MAMARSEAIRIVAAATYISQVLMPSAKGRLVAAFEIMVSNSAVENLIREAKTYQLNSVIQTGKREGMVLLDDHLWELYIAQKITRVELFRKCANPKELREKFENYRNSKGRLWDEGLQNGAAKAASGKAPAVE